MKEKMLEIRAIENNYGSVLFRMRTHLFDVGVRHLTDENIEETIKQIMDEAKKDKENGVITVMTPEFKIEILRCAAELSKHSIWELLAYVKKHVVISD